MSCKIYNGYRLTANGTVADLTYKISLFRRVALPIAKRGAARMVATDVASMIDRSALGTWEGPKRGSPLCGAMHHYMDEVARVEKEQARSPYDWSCSVTVFAGRNPLALLYAEQPELKAAWKKMRFVSEFPYWDNTDEPEGVSREEWKARGAEWDRALGGDGYATPAEAGFTMTVINSMPMIFFAKDVLGLVPSRKARAMQMAQEILLARELKGAKDASEAFRAVRETREAAKGEARRIQGRLPRITLAMIENDIP